MSEGAATSFPTTGLQWVAPVLTGGLGNRLFQYAAAAGAAERWDRPLVFYLPKCGICPHGALSTIFWMFPTVPVLTHSTDTMTTLMEPKGGFYEYYPLGPAPATTEAVLIQGYRQTAKYFPKNPTTLNPNWDNVLGGPALRVHLEEDAGLSDLAERQRTVSIHVRLGDYRRLAHHQQDLSHYYARALERVPRGHRLHLFSDEPDLCAQMFASAATHLGLQFTVARQRSDVESLYEMSLCLGGNITANSTFSWWGAWFAHAVGSPWATYPDAWGAGQPPPTDVVPSWGIRLSTAA